MSREKGVEETENRPKGKAELMFGTKTLQKRLLFGDRKDSKQTKGQGWADVLGANMTLRGMWRVHSGHATAFQKLTLRTIPP